MEIDANLDVLANIWEVNDGLDAEFVQLSRVTDTGEHEEVRRLESPRAQDDLECGVESIGFSYQRALS